MSVDINVIMFDVELIEMFDVEFIDRKIDAPLPSFERRFGRIRRSVTR